ncbi:MAG: hypothetical protein HC842_08045, partial [Cytophagales bacterium]|nr:hypothetical protein [Cytophagales bacterium]
MWFSLSRGRDDWTPPINLGPKINTAQNELSPYYSPHDAVLYFSSDGHQSFGGLDIFRANGKTWGQMEVHNMGLPFNSNRDDFFFALGPQKGTLSSNRVGGRGKFDIYQFDRIKHGEVLLTVGTDQHYPSSFWQRTLDSLLGRVAVPNLEYDEGLSGGPYAEGTLLSAEDRQRLQALPPDERQRINRLVAAALYSALASAQDPSKGQWLTETGKPLHQTGPQAGQGTGD